MRLAAVLTSVALAAMSATRADAASCTLDLTGTKADRAFFVFGMLFESGARRVAAPRPTVEFFFCNETEKVPLFTRVVTAMAREQGLPADLREETKQGCLKWLESPTLAARLDACFRSEPGLGLALFTRPGAPAGNGRSVAPHDLLRRRALAYVAGVWARSEHDGVITLTAGRHKAELVAALLEALGCRKVGLESTVGYIPGATRVFFEPTPEVAEWLRKTW
jgi:hypothetical protein